MGIAILAGRESQRMISARSAKIEFTKEAGSLERGKINIS